MARKVILDVDPGIDDAMALCMALFDPRLEVVAVTAVGGNVPPATGHAQRAGDHRAARSAALAADRRRLAAGPTACRSTAGTCTACDGLGDTELRVAELHHVHPSEKVICDEVRAAPEAVTIVALGPLTNIARAFQRDPDLPSLVGRVVMMGGTVAGPGNITPAAEFNIYCDPAGGPGRVPLADHQDADPPGHHQPRRADLRSLQPVARRNDHAWAISCARSCRRSSAATGRSSAWKGSTSTIRWR